MADWTYQVTVSDVCQINEVDHQLPLYPTQPAVSDVCQINEVDHSTLTDC